MVFFKKMRVNYLITRTTHRLNWLESEIRNNPKNNDLKKQEESVSDELDSLYFEKLGITITENGINRIILLAPHGGVAKEYAIEKLGNKCLKKLAKATSFESILAICKKQREIGCTKVQNTICEKALKYAKCYEEDILILNISPDEQIIEKICKKAIDDSTNSRQISYICNLALLSNAKKRAIQCYAEKKWFAMAKIDLATVKTPEQAKDALQNSPNNNELRYELAYALAMLKFENVSSAKANIQFQNFFESID